MIKNNFLYALAAALFISLFLPAQISSSEKIDLTQYVLLGNENVVGITTSSGFVISTDNGKNWTQRNNGLPFKVVYPFADNEYRRLTSLYVDPVDTNRIAVTDSSSIYISWDGGWNWEEIETGGPVKKSNYFTSISLDPINLDRIILGTSFNGIFETGNNGKSWEKAELDLDLLYRGAGFYEEISGLGVDPDNSNQLYIAVGFSSDIFIGNYLDKKLTLLDSTTLLTDETIIGFDIKKEGIGFYSNKRYFFKSHGNNLWKCITPLFPVKSEDLNPDDINRLSSASNKTGIYVNSFHGSGERLEAHFDFMKKNGFNSMVIDMKDDEGKITYNTSLELPLELGAVRNRFDLDLLLKKAKENNIYVIGRIVVFKDPMLYDYSNSAYSIWDFRKEAPWGNLIKQIDSDTEEVTWVQREFWVDPFSEFVWRYNIAIAEELQSFGIDEIQFDYIRFPSDGDLSTAQYRNKKPGMTKIDALESFMLVAREKLFIPISTDLYGFNSWYRMGNWIGQNIEMLSEYVDVISPMYYPSHFPGTFMNNLEYLERAKYIYSEGTRRSKIITENRSLIRPYVQAFLIGKELQMEYDEYTSYLNLQIEGVEEAGGSGYTMWNSSNRYYMVPE
ncbi:MAG: hypothetical protein PF693_19705 [Spirochaetia bacterium]|jgi:hypothetical protein|nr:hypothetical protein [Spirochaetia bacterium]